VSEKQKGWFHCGRCGSLFQSTMGSVDARQCGECGRDPSIGLVELRTMRAAAPPPAATAGQKDAATQRKQREIKEKRPKASLLPLKIMAIWLLLLGAIVWRFQRNAGDQETSPPARAEGAMTDADMAFLNEALPACYGVLREFLRETTPEGQAQYVLNPLVTGPRMARFYALNPPHGLDGRVEHLGSAILELPDGRAIESQWRASDRRLFETVFRKTPNNEWRLDWEQFARYSDYPWSLFLNGGGDPEGEFRLLAWERLADERKPGDSLSLNFHAPRFGQPGEIDRGSPEFLLDPTQGIGRFMDAAFKSKRSGKLPFNSQLPAGDPKDMIRVRVKIVRTPVERGFAFEIKEVLAGHWLAIEDRGVEVSTLPTPAEPAEPEAAQED
jgi:hypothetical protein